MSVLSRLRSVAQHRVGLLARHQQCRQVRGKPRQAAPLEEELAPVGVSALARPALFAVAFSGGAVSACAVWQYENMRAAAKRARLEQWWNSPAFGTKAGGLRQKLNEWWRELSDGEKLFWPLCGLNVLVFLAWRVPGLEPAMTRLFCCNPAGKARCLPMLLSTFSHVSPVHLFLNMYVLHSFIVPTVHLLGQEQFLAVYLSAGVLSSFASSLYKVSVGKMGYSLGASGAILAVLGMFGTLMPDTRLQIVFLPMFNFTASVAIKGLVAIDTVGLVAGWKFFDHAAHLGGILVGISWCYYGHKYIWEAREPLVTWWHHFRTKSFSD